MTGAPPPALRLTGLGVRYPGRSRPALEGIDLAVGRGEFFGVAGRNGAGKSTLALVVAGFIPRVVRARVEGEVDVAGRPTRTATLAELIREVGIVFATPANQLSSSKPTVREELAFGLENLGVPREEMDGRIDRALAELGIADLAERLPAALSGGEQQRVAIASILVMGPGILVLDEPTAQLDPAGTEAVAALLHERADAGITVVVAEHKPAVLGRAFGCLVLDAGRQVALDAPGRALGSAVMGQLGGAVPTLVAVAEALGLDPRLGFDPATLAAAIGQRATGAPGAARTPPAGAAGAPTPPAVPWQPVRDQPPVAIEIEGLVHRYPGGVEAVRGVDLTIEPGETVAIVGRNGSGKTTLAKHLNGLLAPAEGRVRVGGRDLRGTAVAEAARTVGFVFQDPDDQLFNRSVAREVAFGPSNLRLPGADRDRLVARALESVGLTGESATNPYDLDLSARKLVALASVLAMDPAVLVLDEPTTGQDGPGMARVGALVDAFAAAGRTVIAITHDMEFAARHFRRVVAMREGRVILDGAPEAVFAPGNAAALASTGLTLPPAAAVAAELAWSAPVPLDAAGLVARLRD